MTRQRQQQMEAYRQTLLHRDEQRSLEGSLVDGVKQIEDTLATRAAEAALMPEVIIPTKGAKGKGQRVPLRR